MRILGILIFFLASVSESLLSTDSSSPQMSEFKSSGAERSPWSVVGGDRFSKKSSPRQAVTPKTPPIRTASGVCSLKEGAHSPPLMLTKLLDCPWVSLSFKFYILRFYFLYSFLDSPPPLTLDL